MRIQLQGLNERQRGCAAQTAKVIWGPASGSKLLCECHQQAVDALCVWFAAPVYQSQTLRWFETRRRLNPFQINLD
jgi:hypothetical protein